MKPRIINFTLVISIVLFGISPAYAQKVKFDFQSPPAESMTCGDNTNGISCIEIDSTAPRENQAVLPLTRDLQALPDIQEDTSLAPAMLTDTQRQAMCVSSGGSSAATSVGGFCVASDLRTSVSDFADFAVANDELPVTGLQFLQVTMRDGSTLVGSRELLDADAPPMGAVCASVGGSTATTGNAGGFCMASDLSSDSPAATFSVANGLPVAGMHFLQITFSGTSPIGEPLFNVNAEGAKCVSVDGSTATSGNAGGFCMASDLGTSILGVANFSVANELPAVEMHFLQATFGDSGTSDVFGQGADDAPMGVECVSNGGSTGDAGVSCLASDLSPQITGDANFSVANNLPIASMQFLQAAFGEGNQPSQFDQADAQDTECVSVEGSTATAGDSEGVCMVSDRTISTTSFANFSVANGLPVAALHFFQVPLRDDNQLASLGYLLGGGAPMGVAISDSPRPQLIRPSLPALAGITGHNNRYFRILRQRTGIEIQSSRNQSRDPRPVFWLSR